MDGDSLISRLRRNRYAGSVVPERAVARAVATYRDLMRPARRVTMIPVPTSESRDVRGAPHAAEPVRTFEGEGYRLDLQRRRDPDSVTVGQLRIEAGEPRAGMVWVVSEGGRALAGAPLNEFGEFLVEGRLPSRFYLAVSGDWLRIDLGGSETGGG